MGQRIDWYIGMMVVVALGLSACGGQEQSGAPAATGAAPAPSPSAPRIAPDEPAMGTDDGSTPSRSPVTTTTARHQARPSVTTTTPCVDVGTFQGCPTHGGPAPGSEEDCNSTEPVGPCDLGVVLWNSSTHPGPDYGEVDRAEPGQEITAVAVRLPAGSEVAFCFGETNAGCRVYATQRADAGGTASLRFLVPGDAPAGEYVVAVYVSEEIRTTSELLFVETPAS